MHNHEQNSTSISSTCFKHFLELQYRFEIEVEFSYTGYTTLKLKLNIEGKKLFDEDYQSRQFVVCARDRCGIAVDRIRSVSTSDC